jgi:hypothetical protein
LKDLIAENVIPVVDDFAICGENCEGLHGKGRLFDDIDGDMETQNP